MRNFLKFIPLLLILIMVFLTYKQTLFFDYLWDDDLLIVDNIDLVNSQLNWDIISRPVLQGSSYFRPLVFLSWFTEFKLFGQSSAISHLINLMIFLFNIGLVYWFAYLLGKAKQKENLILLASICAGVYAIHPIHVETTAWVSGRFDLMATFFGLLTCILFTYQLSKQKYSIILGFLIGLSYFCTLMSKEIGLLLPLILFILYMSVSLEKFKGGFLNFFKENYSLVIVVFICFSIYYFLRVSSMHEVYNYSFTWEYYKGIVFEQQVPLYAIKQYFLQALLPFYNLGPIQPTELFIVKNIKNTISIIFVGFCLIYLIFTLVKKKSFFSWMMFGYLVSIILVIFLIPIASGKDIIQDRFMSFGLTFIVIGIVFYITEIEKHSIRVLISLLLLVWSIGAYATTKSIIPFWKNELTLWGWIYQEHSDDHFSRNSYYYSLIKYNRYDDLIRVINDQFISKNKPLHVADQILYAKALLIKKSPESIEYLKGVVFSIPEFHKENSTLKDIMEASAYFQLSPLQIATAYDSLSIATLWFENNPELALQYNYIAEQYLEPSEKYPVIYNRIAFLQILGRQEEADNLAKQVGTIAMYRKNDNVQNIGKIIKIWCGINQIQQKCES